MINSAQCLRRYGRPQDEKHMVLYDVPTEWELYAIPRRVYCNKDIKLLLHKAFGLVVNRDLAHLIRTWDGCFNIRSKRGAYSPSLHSWGVAVDFNAAWNRFGQPPSMDPRLVACFTESGFDWGGLWTKPDGMHFQLREFPK